jgi:hypothetical protein
VERRDELLLATGPERDEDAPHVLGLDDLLEVGHAAQQLEAGLGRHVVDEAHGHEAVLGVLVEQAVQLDAHRAGADDERVLLELPGPTGGADDRVGQGAPHDHGDARDGDLVEQGVGQVHERGDGPDHEEGDTDTQEQTGQLREAAEGEVTPVRADRAEGDEHADRIDDVGPADRRQNGETHHRGREIGDDAQRPRAQRQPASPVGARTGIALPVDRDERSFGNCHVRCAADLRGC